MTVEEAYRVLGLEDGCSWKELRSAYRRRARETHPDVGADKEEFLVVQSAFLVIQEALGATGAVDGPLVEEVVLSRDLETAFDPVFEERLKTIDRAFRDLHLEATEFIRASFDQLRKDLDATIASYASARELREKAQSDIESRYEATARRITKYLEKHVERIARDQHRWLVGYLRPSLDRARYENPPRPYQNRWAFAGTTIVASIALVVALASDQLLWVLPGALAATAAVLGPWRYERKFRPRVIVERLDIRDLAGLRADVPVDGVGRSSGEVVFGSFIASLFLGAPALILGGILAILFWKPLEHIKQEIQQKASDAIDSAAQQLTPQLKGRIREIQTRLQDEMHRSFQRSVERTVLLIAAPSRVRKGRGGATNTAS